MTIPLTILSMKSKRISCQTINSRLVIHFLFCIPLIMKNQIIALFEACPFRYRFKI